MAKPNTATTAKSDTAKRGRKRGEVVPFTDAAVRNLKPKAKPYKVADGEGLYLLVTPQGGKLWRLDYRYPKGGGGAHKTLSLGRYPDVSLTLARERRNEIRQKIEIGIDPAAERKAAKAALQEAFRQEEAKQLEVSQTFEVIAREWLKVHAVNRSADYIKLIERRLEGHLFEKIGDRPIKEITVPELLTALQAIADAGYLETAHRCRAVTGQIFDYAVRTARAEWNPAQALRRTLPTSKPKHFAAILEPEEIGGLLRAIDGYGGEIATRGALQLAALLFCRPGELRRMEWRELNLDQAEWRIPAEKMKSHRPHIVPLSRQAVAILRALQKARGTDPGRYVFSSLRGGGRPMSDATILAALRTLGYSKERMTGHGFRSMASTRLHEMGYPSEIIERQLAHADRDSVRASYNFAEYMPERRKMMQEWADELDRLRAGGDVARHGQDAA